MAGKIKGEFVALPLAMFDEIAEEILHKAMHHPEDENYFKVRTFVENIRKKNDTSIFVKPSAIEGLKKLYDKPFPLPF
jgi:hypothetical protein